MKDVILVLTSVGSEQQAITIAEELVQMELAACVNIMPTMRSVYRYQGKIFDDEENLLLIKTTRELFDEVCEVISQMHIYEIPEIIGLTAEETQNVFVDWVNRCVSSKEHFQG